MFYSSIDGAGVVKSQTQTRITSDVWSTSPVEQNLLTFKTQGIFSFGFATNILSKNYIHHFQLAKGIEAGTSSCVGSDTSGIASTMPFSVSPHNFSWNAIYNNVLVENTVLIITQDVSLTKEEICFSKADPKYPLTLGKDLLMCPGDSVQLQTSHLYKTYSWQDNSTNSIFNVFSAGIYSLKVQDQCDYFYFDTVKVDYSATQLNLQNRFSVCKGDAATLKFPAGFESYSWHPKNDVIEKNKAFEFSPIVTTQYKLEAKDTAGCLFVDSLTVEVKDCLNKFFMPTAFTPNMDGKNEIIKPYLKGRIISYRFSIFDRWGNKIFATTDIHKGWEGKVKGLLQTTATYVWLCEYQFKGEATETKKGSFVLIR